MISHVSRIDLLIYTTFISGRDVLRFLSHLDSHGDFTVRPAQECPIVVTSNSAPAVAEENTLTQARTMAMVRL